MKKVLVTGANGSIGTLLVKRLASSGALVRALCHRTVAQDPWPPGVEVIRGDVLGEVDLKQVVSDIAVVFHLAAKVHEAIRSENEEGEYQAVNFGGTRNLLKAAAACGVRRFVFFSSVKAMGETTEACEDEDAIPTPRTPYGRSKLEAEQAVLEYEGQGLETVCLRLPLVYGPGQKGNLMRMIAAVDRGWFPPLPEFGNRRSMVHVRNVIDAACLAAEHSAARGQRYIVTDAEHHTTREIYELIARALGRPVPSWRVPAAVLKRLAYAGDLGARLLGMPIGFDSDAITKLATSAWYSSGKISRELGYRPIVSFESALPELIAWYRKSQA